VSIFFRSSMDGCAKKPRLEEDRSGSDFNGVAGFAVAEQSLIADFQGKRRPRCPQLPADSKTVLLDIEGTTTLISFVHNDLFPFARRHCRAFLERNWGDSAIQNVIQLLRREAAQDMQHLDQFPRAVLIPDTDQEAVLDAVVQAVEWQMDMDRKAGGLKALQGLIWKDGYTSGELKGHVFHDAYSAMEWWKKHGCKTYIYSSGSVSAQKLLFGQSVFGDLLPLISRHFDTAVGPKVQPASYAALAEQLGVPAASLVFVSDSEAELQAAKAAGVGWPVMCVRPGNAPLTSSSDGLPVVRSLLELCRCADD